LILAKSSNTVFIQKVKQTILSACVSTESFSTIGRIEKVKKQLRKNQYILVISRTLYKKEVILLIIKRTCINSQTIDNIDLF
jgi:hypothetical protein